MPLNCIYFCFLDDDLLTCKNQQKKTLKGNNTRAQFNLFPAARRMVAIIH